MTPIGEIERPRGVETNGIGRVTVAHLNLTRTLADVWPWLVSDKEQKAERASVPDRAPAPSKPKREYERAPRIPYAGKDHPGPLRLVDSSGSMFLHMSGAAMTKDKQYAWCGTRQQLEVLRAKVEAARNLHEVIA